FYKDLEKVQRRALKLLFIIYEIMYTIIKCSNLGIKPTYYWLSERMDITRLNISRPTIQKYLKILEKYNLICRKYSEQKKTKKEIKVTTLGVIFFLIITSDTLKKLKKPLKTSLRNILLKKTLQERPLSIYPYEMKLYIIP
ncbi:MAG: hypothetical protein Q6351_008350, partial [Candidatus Njordarchaeum guaymaensis]